MFLPSKLEASSSVKAGIVILFALYLSLLIRNEEADWNSNKFEPVSATLSLVNHAKQNVRPSNSTKNSVTYDFVSFLFAFPKLFVTEETALRNLLLFVTIHLHSFAYNFCFIYFNLIN